MKNLLDLNNEDRKTVCKIITGKKFKEYFKHNPKEFGKLFPGFRPNTMTDEKAENKAFENFEKDFILTFVTNIMGEYINEIDGDIENKILDGISKGAAILNVCLDIINDSYVDIYFKLTEKEYLDDYVDICKESVKLLRERDNKLNKKDECKPDLKVLQKKDEQINALEEDKKELNENIKKLGQEAEELNAKAERTGQQLHEINEKLKFSEQIVKEQEIQLKNFKEKSTYEENEEFYRDEEFQYTSLCRVDIFNGQLTLKRFTDIENGALLGGYTYDSPNRDVLYTRENFENGFVGVWDWKYTINENGNQYIQSSFNEQYKLIEIVHMDDCLNIKKVIEKLKAGVIYSDWQERIIFVYRTFDEFYTGVGCSIDQFEIVGNEAVLKSDVLKLPVYEFDKNLEICFDNKYYKRTFNMKMPKKLVDAFDPMDIVKEILVNKINKTFAKDKGLTRHERQELGSLIKSIDLNDIYLEIAEDCECSIENSKQYLKDFLDNAEKYFLGNEFNADILNHLVNNVPLLKSSCEKAIEEEWKRNNAEKQQEMAVLEEKTNKLKSEAETYKTALNSKQELSKKVEQQVNERIKKIKDDASQFVADYLIESPFMNVQGTKNQSMTTFTSGNLLNADDDKVDDYIGRIDFLSEQLIYSAGVSKKMANSLAIYLYSAYYNKMPVILAGANSVNITNALSSSVSNSKAAILNLNGQFDSGVIRKCKESDDVVVCIKNPFSVEWQTYLPEIISDKNKFYILTVPYAEELLIEPKSLFQYCLPILTDVFIDELPGEINTYVEQSEDYEEYISKREGIKDKYSQEFTGSMLSANQLDKVINDSYALNYGFSKDAECMFALLPNAYVMNKLEYLKQLIDDGKITFDNKKEMMERMSFYLGKENE